MLIKINLCVCPAARLMYISISRQTSKVGGEVGVGKGLMTLGPGAGNKSGE